MTKMKRLIYILIVSLVFVACSLPKELLKVTGMNKSTVSSTGQQAIVYKTIGDFDDYVPVIMNVQKTKILAYPAPTDLFYKGKLAKPTPLKNGYLLDNRGITENVVFLNYTYEAYSQLKEAPILSDMAKNIKEKYPLKEFINCGSRYQFKDEQKELNAIIESGFPNCKKLKLIPMGVDL